jgi:transposase
VSVDPTLMCELLVSLPDVNVLAVAVADELLRVMVETHQRRPTCPGCGGPVQAKDRADVEHADLPCFGRCAVLVWRKRRWECASRCGAPSFTENAGSIAAPRQRLTDRAGRWATIQVGRRGRPVSDVASELGASWDAVVAYGQALIDDPARFADVEALGLDETLQCKTGPWRRQVWSTQIVDVGRRQLLDMVEGRNATGPAEWLDEQPDAWRANIKWGALDLSGPGHSVRHDAPNLACSWLAC